MRTKQNRKKETERKIVLAAAEIIKESSAEVPTARAIAERAGVGIGTVYRYFASVDDIVHEVYSQWMWSWWDDCVDLRESVTTNFTYPAYKKLVREFIREQVRMAEEHPSFPSDEAHQAVRRERFHEVLQFGRTLIEKAGSRVRNPSMAAQVMTVAPVMVIDHYLKSDPSRVYDPEFEDELADLTWFYITSLR